MNISPVSIELLETVFSRLERGGVSYGYGVKAPSLSVDTSEIVQQGSIDCSGFSRYALYKASGGKLIIPDGSQMQREYFESSGLHQLGQYADVTQADPSRLFICFIKPGEHGCGDVGHVWLVRRANSPDGNWKQEVPHTLESHGGGGCTSRPWNYRTLLREWWNGFELPTVA